MEACIAEGENATVGTLKPIALPVRSGGDPDNRTCNFREPVEPWNWAEPKEKMPPSAPTSQ